MSVKRVHLPERPQFYVQTGSMFENPYGVPPDEIVRMILDNPAEVVAQVVFGKYVESSGLVFTGDLIQMLFDRRLPAIKSSAWADAKAVEQARALFSARGWFNNRFYTGIDFARQTDYTVIVTLDCRTLPAKVVYYRRLNRVSWDEIYAEVGKARYLFGPNILCDSTGPGGDVVMDALESRYYCPKHHRTLMAESPRCLHPTTGNPLDCERKMYLPLSCCEGFDFNNNRKKLLIDHTRNVMSVGKKQNPDNFGWVRCPPLPQLEEEMIFYAWDDKKLVTDTFFGFALACWHGLEERIGDAAIGSIYGR